MVCIDFFSFFFFFFSVLLPSCKNDPPCKIATRTKLTLGGMLTSCNLVPCATLSLWKVPSCNLVTLCNFDPFPYLLSGKDTSILLIELFIAYTSIIHKWLITCNGSYMIKSCKKTVVLTCIELRLKTLNTFKSNCSKYRFNRLLTKDPSETSSLEYK